MSEHYLVHSFMTESVRFFNYIGNKGFGMPRSYTNNKVLGFRQMQMVNVLGLVRSLNFVNS